MPAPQPQRREKLTAEQQQMVIDALVLAERYISRACRQHDRAIDVRSAVHERLCCSIASFDPARSSLTTWTLRQAMFAIREEYRRLLPGGRHRPDLRVHPFSTLMRLNRNHEHEVACESLLGVEDPTNPAVTEDEIGRLTDGLRRESRLVLVSSVVHERTLKSIGADLGITESRACQIRSDAIQWLRQHRSAEVAAG